MNFSEIIAKAKDDPKFFHELAFNPESVAKMVDSPELKESILGLNANVIFGKLARGAGLQWCGNTCGSSSCLDTCGSNSCSGTCADSCGTTCSNSCGDTTSIRVGIDRVGNPAVRF